MEVSDGNILSFGHIISSLFVDIIINIEGDVVSIDYSKISANKLWLICSTLLMISGCAMQQMGGGSQSATPLPNPTSSSQSSGSMSSSGGISFPSSQPQSSGSDGAQGSSDSNSQQSTDSSAEQSGTGSQQSQSGTTSGMESSDPSQTGSRKQEERAQILVQCHQVNLHPAF